MEWLPGQHGAAPWCWLQAMAKGAADILWGSGSRSSKSGGALGLLYGKAHRGESPPPFFFFGGGWWCFLCEEVILPASISCP